MYMGTPSLKYACIIDNEIIKPKDKLNIDLVDCETRKESRQANKLLYTSKTLLGLFCIHNHNLRFMCTCTWVSTLRRTPTISNNVENDFNRS